MKISETYRKYIVEINLCNFNGFVVWGADLEDVNENDVFLVSNDKIIFFNDLKTMKDNILKYSNHYFDKHNFSEWVSTENFSEPYSKIDLSLLKLFDASILIKETTALDLLDGINITQDFFNQIKDNDTVKLFESTPVADLKDYLYNKYFWENTEEQKFKADMDDLKVRLEKIYTLFTDHLAYV